MFWTNTKRVFRSGFVQFWRNGVVSLAAVAIMTVTLFVIGLVFFLGALLQTSLEEVRNKVDVNVYFTTDAPEDEVLKLADQVKALPEVANVTYTSREDALAEFRERHKDDFLTLQALEELGENPLGATLAIKAKQPSQYESIARFLTQASDPIQGKSIIDKVNYYQNKAAIDALSRIITGVQTVGLGTIIFLVLVSVLITFNTLRLAIYSAREEIGVMRLVGASNMYIRGPFLVEGIFYGLSAALIVMILFYPATWWAGDLTERFFGSFNVYDYYLGHFGEFFLIIAGSGIILGVVASFLAVRRYLHI